MGETTDMTETDFDAASLRASGSVTIARSPEDVYDMVADITRMGEWSPACRGGRWDDGSGPRTGAWFTGVNAARDREYETRNEIVVASRPHEIAWVAGGADEGWARWGYQLEPTPEGTIVTESWEPVNLRNLVPDLTLDMAKKMSGRSLAGIHDTLASLKAAAEAV
jgi:hypothetical protein